MKTMRTRRISSQAKARLQVLANAQGCLYPETVLEEAREPTSPLHNYFEWDDSEAALGYRLEQARSIIACVMIKPVADTGPVRAYVTLSDDSTGKYEAIDVVLRNKKKRNLLLEAALKELQAFERKYSCLKELAGLFETARNLRKKVS